MISSPVLARKIAAENLPWFGFRGSCQFIFAAKIEIPRNWSNRF